MAAKPFWAVDLVEHCACGAKYRAYISNTNTLYAALHGLLVDVTRKNRHALRMTHEEAVAVKESRGSEAKVVKIV